MVINLPQGVNSVDFIDIRSPPKIADQNGTLFAFFLNWDNCPSFELLQNTATCLLKSLIYWQIMVKKREFVDALNHPGVDRYREIVEIFRGGDSGIEAFVDKLYDLVEEDPFFFDPYLTMVDLLGEAELHDESASLLETAYKKIVQLITDKNGNWPDKLRWRFLRKPTYYQDSYFKGCHVLERRSERRSIKSFWQACEYESERQRRK